MATMLAVLALALLLTGAATATAYAAPILTRSQGNMNSDGTKDQTRLRTRDCSGAKEMTQAGTMLQTREQARNCSGDCECECLGSGPNSEVGPEQNQYQSQAQNCFGCGPRA